MKNVYKLGLASIAASISLVGCGGGSSDTPTLTGDTYVAGLNYTCLPSGTTGTTDSEGKYSCPTNGSAEFEIGDYTLGSITMDEGEVVTPYDLYPTDPIAAINVARILLSIDDNLTDDIMSIPAGYSALDAFNVAPDDDNFITSVENNTDLNVTVSANEARDELQAFFIDHGLPVYTTKNTTTDEDTAKTITLALENIDYVSGSPLTYSIERDPSNGSADISNESVTYTPASNYNGTDVFQVNITDGNVSEIQIVTVTVNAVNDVPVADAGTAQDVTTGSLVTLDGGGSDIDSDTLTYTWSFTSIPTGSTASLSDASVEDTTFTADVAGDYVLQLVVNDGTVDSEAATVTITASDAPTEPVTTEPVTSVYPITDADLTNHSITVDGITHMFNSDGTGWDTEVGAFKWYINADGELIIVDPDGTKTTIIFSSSSLTNSTITVDGTPYTITSYSTANWASALSGYSYVFIYKNLSADLANTLRTTYESYNSFYALDLGAATAGSISCTDLGFNASNSTVTTIPTGYSDSTYTSYISSDYTKSCSEYDYAGVPYVSGSTDVALTYNF